MTNRLANESSPYLLQHAENPVDWHPWGEEALSVAKQEKKPIFLSIGYSACHWCHVMEHESFENEDIAKLLNERFLCIKVDREERPDLDQIYMNAVQLMTGRGGWPMSVFLTPDLHPFYGGTYWPPFARQGMPGFDQIIHAVHNAWLERRGDVENQAAQLTEHLHNMDKFDSSGEGLRPELLKDAGRSLEKSFDFTHGGFGAAPKFPHAMDIRLLFHIWRRFPRPTLIDMARLTLDKMAQGGIYDHLAGGFARYSVDQRWLVPHFEKMLYDNALLSNAYLDGYLVTRDKEHARIARETFDYVLNYMTDEQGCFHSTEDADSEGVEGKFYVWSPDEIKAVLGEEAGERFCYVYDVSENGNFEGKSILNLRKTIPQCAAAKGWDVEELKAELANSRAELLKARDQRVRPGKDDKALVSWNALMIDSMARGAVILDDDRYLKAATGAAEFIFTNMRRPDGRLLHSWRGGQAKFDAYLDDYAGLMNALLSLYEADFDERWIDEAISLGDVLMTHFRDYEKGGFYYTADDHEKLISRNKDFYDSSVPSGNALAACAMFRLARLCGRADYWTAATETLEAAEGLMERAPSAAGQLLIGLDMWLGPLQEIVILGDRGQSDTRDVLNDLRRKFVPNRVIAWRREADYEDSRMSVDPIFVGKEAESGAPTVYICERFTCQAPIVGKEAALDRWQAMASVARSK